MFKQYGFTLIEITIVILILTIMSLFAIPQFQNMMIAIEIHQLQQTLSMYLQQAKTDARLYHQNITLCPSQDLISCHHNWNQGFIGFLDINKNHQREANEELIYTDATHYQYGHLDWRDTLHQNSITFQADTGLPRGSNGSFFYCMYQSHQHIRILLSPMGQIRVEKIESC